MVLIARSFYMNRDIYSPQATAAKGIRSTTPHRFYSSTGTPAETFVPTVPKNIEKPIEYALFAEPAILGEGMGGDVGVPEGPSAVETGLISPETGEMIGDVLAGTFGFSRDKSGSWGMTPMGLLSNISPFPGRILNQALATGARYANAKLGDPVGKLKGKIGEFLYSHLPEFAQRGMSPIGLSPADVTGNTVATIDFNNLQGQPTVSLSGMGVTAEGAGSLGAAGNFGSGSSPSGFGGYEGAMLGGGAPESSLAGIDFGGGADIGGGSEGVDSGFGGMGYGF